MSIFLLDTPGIIVYTTTCKENHFTGGVYMKDLESISEILDEKYELSLLYDYYGGLLKNNHKEIFELYVLDDMSLSEIASEQGITRQGVHDSIKRTTKQLWDYEHNLNLVEKGKKINKYLKEMKEQLYNNLLLSENELKDLRDLIDNISREV